MTQLWRDLRYSARTLARTPVFTASVVLTLALGIGANATMFGVVDSLFLRPPAGVRRADEVVRVYFRRGFLNQVFTSQGTTFPAFRDLRDAGIFSAVSAVGGGSLSLGRGPSATSVDVAAVSHSYFPLLGVSPALGRFFTADDDRTGAPQTAVLSWGYWQAHFAGDSAVIGRALPLGGGTYTVIGVAPRGFTGIDLAPPSMWLPIEATGGDITSPEAFNSRNWMWNSVIARLKPGARREDAAAAATIAFRRGQLAGGRRDRSDSNTAVILGPTQEARGPEASSNAKVSAWIGFVALAVLLIACANVANLLLARAVARRRELAVRAGLGAGRAGLIRLLLGESLVLALLGGGGAILIATWGGALIRGFLIPDLPADVPVLDARVLAFSAFAVLLTAVLTGLVPAIQSSRTDLAEALKAGGRGATARGGRTRGVLLGFQIALTAVLLVGAGLFVRSLRNAQHIDLGFDADRVLEASVDMGAAHLTTAESNGAYLRILDRIQRMPGVEAAATTMAPFGWGFARTMKAEGWDSMPEGPGGGPYLNVVSPGYFRTMGSRVRQGRVFTTGDVAGAERVAVISETMAHLLWPGKPALGKCLYFAPKDPPCVSVVGVIGDAKRGDVVSAGEALYWIPLAQADSLSVPGEIHALVIRPQANTPAFVDALRREIQAGGDLPYARVTLLADRIAPQYRSWQLGAAAFTAFGALALAIAAMGIFAVISYSVSRRTQEIGVRMALGAEAEQVARMILGQGLRAAIVGVVIGALGAFAMARALRSLLYGVPPTDPAVFAAATLTLLLVAALAAWLPARRAAAIDPMIALRND